MKEHAFFMFQNHPMIELFFENERLVAHKDLDYVAPIPHANWAKGLTTPQLESYLLDRRIAEGRSHRKDTYFGGKSLSKYQEMKAYRGADADDECWIKYSDDDLSAERVLTSLGSSPKGDQISGKTKGTSTSKTSSRAKLYLSIYALSSYKRLIVLSLTFLIV